MCRVDIATCPDGSGVDEGGLDACTPLASAAPVEQQGVSWHGCDCKPWTYSYADGSKDSFSGCANPDGDTLGPWCVVDAASCSSFAGVLQLGNTVSRRCR